MRRHAATAVVLLLLVGTAVAFAETERLKVQPTPIEESFVQPAFSPTCDCDTATTQIRMRLHKADRVSVRILDESDHTVRHLADGRHLPAGRSVLEWDGKDDDGARAPDGRYHVEVHLLGADRTFRLPRQIALDTVPPRIRLVSYTNTAQVGQLVRVFYRASEPAHGVLYVDGVKTVGPTYTHSRSAKLQWRPRAPGRYGLELAAVDLAGNLGPRTPVFEVRVSSAG